MTIKITLEVVCVAMLMSMNIMYPGNIGSGNVGGKKTDATNPNKAYYPHNPAVVDYARGIPAGSLQHQHQNQHHLAHKNDAMIQAQDPSNANYLGQLQLLHLQQAAPMEYMAYNSQMAPHFATQAAMKKPGMGSVPLVQSTSSHISNAEQLAERSVGRGRSKNTRSKKRKTAPTKPASRKSTNSSPQTIKRSKKDTSVSKWNDAEDEANMDEETRRERKNEREKQRRQEISTQFQNLVDILDIPKNSGADKVTILAKAVETIKALKNALIVRNTAAAGFYIPREGLPM